MEGLCVKKRDRHPIKVKTYAYVYVAYQVFETIFMLKYDAWSSTHHVFKKMFLFKWTIRRKKFYKDC